MIWDSSVNEKKNLDILGTQNKLLYQQPRTGNPTYMFSYWGDISEHKNRWPKLTFLKNKSLNLMKKVDRGMYSCVPNACLIGFFTLQTDVLK